MDYGKYTVAIRNGDAEAFRDYMDSTLDSIYSLVHRILASEDDAMDITQETYIRLWEKRGTLRMDKSIYSFTRRIAVNKCYDQLRTRKRNKEWNIQVDGKELRNLISEQNADDEINNKEYLTIMKSLISGLSSKQQIVFTLSVIQKLDADEIAGVTGFSKNSIKSNLYHARKAVKKRAERIL